MPNLSGSGRRAGRRTGLILILLGVVLNEWVCARLLSADHSLALSSRLGIWLLDLGLIAAGLALVAFRVVIPWKVVVGNLVVFGFLLSLTELALIYGLRRPVLLPSGKPPGMVAVLYAWHRNIIQFSRDCARYDPRFGYTLRPGVCTFSNPEFSNEYRINSLGLRDDEASLAAPRTIVLGDSFAMGWGVDQRQTFPELLEASLGSPVLNAAISSYGTARASLMLAALDRTGLEVLIIQYGSNDFEENEVYRDSGSQLAVSSPEKYRRRVEVYERDRRYRFGSYLFKLTKLRLVEPALLAAAKALSPARAAGPRPAAPPDARRQADAFLHVLDSVKDLLPDRILVLEINRHAEMSSAFVDEVAAQSRSRADDSWAGSIETLDLSDRLTPDGYFRLDDHLNAEGHQVVATAILEQLALGRSR